MDRHSDDKLSESSLLNTRFKISGTNTHRLCVGEPGAFIRRVWLQPTEGPVLKSEKAAVFSAVFRLILRPLHVARDALRNSPR